MSHYSSINTEETPSPSATQFTISSPPGTDIYAAPAHGYVWTAPIIYKRLKAASQFQKAQVTVKLDWKYTYDQGGLLLAFPQPSNPVPDATNATTKETHPLWIKAGVEINDGKPWVSVVARETWADWSLASPPESSLGMPVKVTLELERHGDALMVWVVDGQSRFMIREVQWVFLDGRNDAELWVGAYCCRPDAQKLAGDAPLDVIFEDFNITEG